MALVRETSLTRFKETVWEWYRTQGRHDLPWRLPEPDDSFSPYKILVSEVMLQQTQVSRVIPKYHAFLQQFPTVHDLAAAPLATVLLAWSGLGYNRRAKFLWQAAQMVMQDFGGVFPATQAELVRLPGVGPNTAGAVLAYAYNKPAVFIETNIRTVYIYHFFSDQTAIPDRLLADLVARTVPGNVREWYWALMDYGAHLKQTVGNLNTLSKHYAKQSAFEGSQRQLRGQVLRLVGAGPASDRDLARQLADPRLTAVLGALEQEGLLEKAKGRYRLSGML